MPAPRTFEAVQRGGAAAHGGGREKVVPGAGAALEAGVLQVTAGVVVAVGDAHGGGCLDRYLMGRGGCGYLRGWLRRFLGGGSWVIIGMVLIQRLVDEC